MTYPPPPPGAPGYGGQPQPGCGAPQPQPGYGAPQPQPGYGQPQPPPGYGQPAPGQWAPPPGPPGAPGPFGAPGAGGPGGYGTGAYPPAGPPPKKRTGLIVGLVALVVVLGLIGAALAFVVLRSDDSSAALPGVDPGPSGEPSETWNIDVADQLLVDGDPTEFVLAADAEQAYLVTEEDNDDSSSANSGTITAFDIGSGDEVWQTDFDSEFLSSDSVHPVAGHGLLVQGADPDVDDDDSSRLRLYDVETGDELWEVTGALISPFSFQLDMIYAIRDSDVVLVRTLDPEDFDATTHAIDLASGEVLWDADGGDGVICGERAYLSDDDDVVAHDLMTGDELWDASGQVAGCDGTSVIAADGADIAVLDPDDGEETASIELPDDPGDDGGSVAAVVGDGLLVTSFAITDSGDSTSNAGLYPFDGGDPLWEEDDHFAFAFGADRFLASENDSDELQMFDGDGREVSDVETFDESDENECDGAFTTSALISCESGSADVTAFSSDDLREEWTVDVGGDVLAVAVGGSHIVVLTEDAELIALD